MSDQIIQNYIQIKNDIVILSNKTNLIVVSKNQSETSIKQILNLGQIHFGENRIQEAIVKWPNLKELYPKTQLHFIGNIQSNKVNNIINLFDYVHSLDSKKLVEEFSKYEKKNKKNIKYFIQINLGDEVQKSGINMESFEDFFNFCKVAELNVVGLMCIPPINKPVEKFFSLLKNLADKYNINNLSMGMSNDYKQAMLLGSTWVRIGSKIFSNYYVQHE